MAEQSAAMAAPRADAQEDALYATVTRHLMPILLTVFTIAYLDRVNIGLAKLQMAGDLGLSDAVYGLGAGIFYVAYVIFEVPSNLILHRLGARLWITRIAVSWGLISMAMALVGSTWSFYTLRILLGVAECGLFPGIILYLTYWYPAARRAKMVAIFMAALPLSGLIGGPLSGWIIQHLTNVAALRGWQWMFLLEGLPSVLSGIAVWFLLPNGIKDAGWLTAAEREILAANIAAENAAKPTRDVRAALLSPRVWLMGGMLFAFATGNMGISFWLPTIVQRAGHQGAQNVGLLTAIPYIFAAGAMVALAVSSDRTRERRWHLALPAFLGAALLLASSVWSQDLTGTMVTMTLASMAVFAVAPLLWAQPTALLAGTGAAAGIAMISSLGNLAGVFSPTLFGYLTQTTHSTTAGLCLLAAFMVLGGLFALATPARMVNK